MENSEPKHKKKKVVFDDDEEYKEDQVLDLGDIEFETLKTKKKCSCPKILIVDDNSFNVFTLKTILEMELKLLSDSVSLSYTKGRIVMIYIGIQWVRGCLKDTEQTRRAVWMQTMLEAIHFDLHGHFNAYHGWL